MTTPDRTIGHLAATQHGVFTLVQSTAAGFTRPARDRRLRSGRWLVVYPGVYRMAGAPSSWRGQLLATCWEATPSAVASHRSAAALWGLAGGRTDLLEITCLRWRRAQRDGLVVHETNLLGIDDVMEVDCVPVTTPEQTLLGLAAVVRPAVVEMALDQALRQGFTTRRGLEAFVARKRGRGRNGIGVLRTLLAERDPLAGIPESVMETRLKQLLRRHDLPVPEFQYVIRHEGRFVARVDAAYPDLRIAIEYDSFEHHTGKLAIVRDNDRRNTLTRIRWTTVTFTAKDVRDGGGYALTALRAARQQASAAFGVNRAS